MDIYRKQQTKEEIMLELKEQIEEADRDPIVQQLLKEMGERISQGGGYSIGPLQWDPEDDDVPDLNKLYGADTEEETELNFDIETFPFTEASKGLGKARGVEDGILYDE